MKENKLAVRITFTEPLLGTASGNKEIHEEYIASKAETATQAAEETEAIVDVGEQLQKATTIFPRDETGLFLWDYQVKGFLKEAIGALVETGDCQIKAFRKAALLFVHVSPRRIYLRAPAGEIWKAAPEHCSRPLRAETAQGPRVALARSEMLPIETTAQFTISWLTGANEKAKKAVFTEDHIRAALDFGKYVGLGQWRSGSHGRFTWQ